MKMKKILIVVLFFTISGCVTNNSVDEFKYTESSKDCRNALLDYKKVISGMCEKLITTFNYYKKEDGNIYFDRKNFLDTKARFIFDNMGALKNNEISIVLYTIKKDVGSANNLFVNEDIRTYPLDYNIKKTSYYSDYNKFGKDRININYLTNNGIIGDFVFDIVFHDLNVSDIMISGDPKYISKSIDSESLISKWNLLYSRGNEDVYVKSFVNDSNINKKRIFSKNLPDTLKIHSYYQYATRELNDYLYFLYKEDYLLYMENKILHEHVQKYSEEKDIYFVILSSESYHIKHSRNSFLYSEHQQYMNYQKYKESVNFGIFNDKDYELNTFIHNGHVNINSRMIIQKENIGKKKDYDVKNWNIINQEYRNLRKKNPVEIIGELDNYDGVEEDLKSLTLVNRIVNKSKTGYIEIYAIIPEGVSVNF